MAINDGGPAFPTMGDDFTAPGPDGSRHPKSAYGFEGAPGMSLRDWFAGQALQGMLAGADNPNLSYGAKSAYQYADAMLAERDEAANVSKDSEIAALKRLLYAELERSRKLSITLGGLLIGAHDKRATISRAIILDVRPGAVHIVEHPERGDVTAVYGG